MTIWLVVGGVILILLFLFWIFRTHGSQPCTGNNLHVPRIVLQNDNAKILNIKPVRGWGWGLWSDTLLGYCGEYSFQMISLYYGNYISQEQVLKAAGGSFMIGVNDSVMLQNMHMMGELWPNVFGKGDPSIYDILNYIKKQIDNNCPVILGLYCNEDGGDLSFDHQCVACGYTLDPIQGNMTTIWLLDGYELRLIPFDCSLAPYECLSGDTPPCPNPPPVFPNNPNYPDPPFPKCYKRREDFANPDKQAPYDVAIPNILNAKDPKTGDDLGSALLSIKGNIDPNNELFPCWLQMNAAFEPNWGSEDQIYAPPGPISCKVYIEGLTGNKAYSLLRFDNPYDVPVNGNFINSYGYTMRVDFVACGSNNMIEVKHDPAVWPFMSNGTYFFRCVETKGVPMKQNFPYGTNRTDPTPGPTPPAPTSITSMMPQTNVWNTTGWTNKFQDVVTNRIDEYWRKIRGMPRKHGKRPKRKTRAPPKLLKNCTKGPLVPAAITCGDSSSGNINGQWEWDFGEHIWTGQKIGCFVVTLTVQDPGAEAANCVNFTVENTDDKPPITLDSVTGVIIYNADGTEPRFYIEDVTNVLTYSFSPNPQEADGSFKMMSQDFVTWSTLRPVATS